MGEGMMGRYWGVVAPCNVSSPPTPFSFLPSEFGDPPPTVEGWGGGGGWKKEKMEAAPRLQRGGQLQCKNLHEFLRGLSPPLLDRLYGHPATCLAVFRSV